jgi:hypothetical protein
MKPYLLHDFWYLALPAAVPPTMMRRLGARVAATRRLAELVVV